MLTSIVGAVTFAMFVLLYVTAISPELMMEIKSQEPFGDYLNPFLVAFTIALEGVASGMFVSYGLLQYFRPNHLAASSELSNS